MDLEKVAIMRLREGAEISKYYYGKPLMLCYSGGKDSEIILDLALKSGIDFEVLHSHTTADAPETVYHIRRKFKELESKGIKCTTQMPTFKGKSVSMWSLIPTKKIPPTRLVRYCCAILKETATEQTNETYNTDLFEIIENADIMRLQLRFDCKPDADTRTVLKQNGFRWSPSNGVWQRQLTDNAKFALERVIEELKVRQKNDT